MITSNSAIDAVSLLVWATFLPLVIVLVMRSRGRHEDPSKDKHTDMVTPPTKEGESDRAP